ncbi:MAG: hypothetical protein ACR2N5_02685 [Solirubrobacterales bacterium]
MEVKRIRGRRWPRLTLAVAALAAAGVLVACGGDDDDDDDTGDTGGDTTEAVAESEPRDVYLNTYAQGIPYFDDWQSGATFQAEEYGWSVEAEQGNTTPE